MNSLLEILHLQESVAELPNVDNSISVASYLNKAQERKNSNLTQN